MPSVHCKELPGGQFSRAILWLMFGRQALQFVNADHLEPLHRAILFARGDVVHVEYIVRRVEILTRNNVEIIRMHQVQLTIVDCQRLKFEIFSCSAVEQLTEVLGIRYGAVLFGGCNHLNESGQNEEMVTPPSRTMSDLLSTFDAVLEHYHENFASVAHQTEVAARLRQLRTTMFEHLPTIADTFIQTMEPLPNLVRLNESQRDFICFGDLHGSLTDLVNLRHTYWRDGPQLAKFHFVFLGIPRILDSLDDINTKIPKGLISEMRHQVALQLLWNDFRSVDYDRLRLYDPDDTEQEERQEQTRNFSVRKYFIDNSERNIGCVVGHKAVRAFLRRHSLNYIIRAHQYDSMVKVRGYNTHSDRKVLTIFSNSNYLGHSNATACCHVRVNSVDVTNLSPAQHGDDDVRSEIFENEELANMLHDG
ncbi:hypothetical protein TYRP_014259 [Tyrophagus putrescentiae]|nr:hypothetical protein TYRP_014259 [Tyrophagus putrescentiae]